MSRVVVINHVTLDGVMQSPGRPEEDTRDGFTHGGWASPNVDDVVMTALGARRAGRRHFADGTPPARMRLIDSAASSTGVLITTYQPDRA